MAGRVLRAHPRMALVFLAAAVGQGILQGVFLWALRDVLLEFDEGTVVSIAALTFGAGVIGGIWVLRALLTYAGEAAKHRLAYRAEMDGVHRALAKLLRVPIAFFERNTEGDLVMAAYHDLSGIRTVILQIGTIAMTVARLAGLAVVAWMISPVLALIGFVAVPLGALPTYWLGRRITRAARRQRAQMVLLHDVFFQLSSGMRIVRVSRSEARMRARAERVGEGLYAAEVRQAELKHLARLVLEVVSGLGLIAVLVIGGRDVVAGTLDWQALLALLIAMMAVYAPVLGLLSVYSDIRSVIPKLDRSDELLATPEEPADPAGARRLSEAPRTIELQNVSFSYDRRERALDSITLTVSRGETIGLVGPSGSGKSTLMALLLRLYEPTGGRILLDGIDVRHVRRADLLSRSAIVLQEPFLFADTIANNIRWARPDASLEAVIAAAKAAYIHDEIVRMPDGYDTLLGRGEAGRGVSLGQKQRICIAAALLKDAPLLFLDEPTSNLDAASEHAVQAAIERLTQGRTTFVIAHRLSTLQQANRIVVLERGRIVAVGTHRDLLKSCEPYQTAWQQQTAPAGWRPAPASVDVAAGTMVPRAVSMVE
jgi:subfamily B ATP-binding cassette protein MsbA